MQVIEKVKVVPEGYNGAGMNYDGCNRRDVNGKEAYRRNAIPNANNGTTQNQQVPTQGIWDAIDAEIAPLTQEQQNMLLNNQDYVNNYNALQSMVQAEVLNLVRGKIEASEDGKHLLEEQLKLVKLLKSKIVEVTNKEMELFKAFKEASKTNPNLTYEEFLFI
jgi:hypothetical protein|nr:MAG TPA: hypothetical protein [Crassvirales sp.]